MTCKKLVMNKMKKIIVIGGSGFIGSHVVDHLEESGYSVTIFDKKVSPWARSSQRMVLGDITDLNGLIQVCKDAHAVYNFSALSDLNIALKEPLKTIEINILGNANILEACRINDVERFIYASSVYVNSREGGFYRCSKQASEEYIREYQKVYGLNYTILRYGSLYGPRSDLSNGITRVITHALENSVIRYEGMLEAMREYIHVQDAAEASVLMLNDEFINSSIVLTGQEPMRVLDVLKMLAEIMGLPESSIDITNSQYPGHYIRTPYSFHSTVSKKYIPPMHIDLGQGLLSLIKQISEQNE